MEYTLKLKQYQMEMIMGLIEDQVERLTSEENNMYKWELEQLWWLMDDPLDIVYFEGRPSFLNTSTSLKKKEEVDIEVGSNTVDTRMKKWIDKPGEKEARNKRVNSNPITSTSNSEV